MFIYSPNTKGRKNVRNSRRQSNVALEEETSDSTRRDTDDIFAIPSTSCQPPRSSRRRRSTAETVTTASDGTPELKSDASTSCQPPRSSRRRRSTAETVTTASDGTPELKSDASTSNKERSRSPATTTTDDDNGLLQYLDEGSCGFEREKSEQGTFPVDQNTDVLEPLEKSPSKKARSNQESRDQPDIVIFDENEDDVAESNSRLERNDNQDVSNLNEKNLRSRPLNDIENVIEAGNARPRQKGKDEEPSSGAPDNSQNSSNASISSTQQLLQLPVVTKTYGRRSGNKKDSDAKVQDWITALPQNHTSKKNTDVLNQKSKQRQSENATGKVLEVESDRVEKKNSSAEVLTATIDAHAFCGDDDEDVMEVEDPAQESKKGHTAYLSLQEPEEEIMLTPPIRKKRIFKRKDVEIDENPLKVYQENSPTADPYLFIAGNTPVAKSKKRGRPRPKEKKGNPPQFTLDKGAKKTVRFSDVTFTEPRGASFIQHSKVDEKGTSNTEVFRTADKPTTSEDARVTEGPIEPSHLETDSLFETADDTSADVQFVCPKTTTRSRSKQTKQQNKKGSSGEESQAEEKKKPRKKSSSKVETPEAQKAREEQTRDLASLIGQAEDHDLLFSTQDAHASMDDTDGKEYAETSGQSFAENVENNKITAVDVGEDDSNDGFCLMGPLPEERLARMSSSQQNREFDAIATEITAVADQTGNDKTAGTEKTQKKPTKEKKTELPGKNKMASSSDQTVVAETQMSSLQSPASCNVVLPSPLPGSTLPKFSTPKLQNARQTRSARRGSTEDDFNTGRDRFKHFAKILDVTPIEANHLERDIEMGASQNVYQKSPEASKRLSDRLRRHKGGSATNSPLVTTVPSTFTEERCSGSTQSPHTKALEEAGSKGRAFDVDHYTLTCVPDTAEKDSHPRPSRSPLHGKPSILFKSPASTASPAPITSSATRNSPRSSKILSTQTEHTEGNLRKTAEARSNQKYLNSRPCKEVTQHKMVGEDSGHTSLKQAKSKREGEEDAVVCAGNKSELAEAEDNVSVSKRASRGDNYSKVKDVTASEVKSRGTDADLMKTNVVVKGHSDPEADSFSSSTDDLEIMPSENEFEEPDLSD
ncbi:enolase-phosphatase E1-like [Littorina saxatilis]|uniref:enolase-phosphatase E1-like n=1 Tax=Littorina saxatilis TaxID=31220 RepID=UPI0038B63D77